MIIGSTISHYKIVEKLGEGGMGVVYKAEDTKLNRLVALKFLAQHLLDDAEAKERFVREAQAAAALHHSNVCPVYEIDEVDGKTFLAMAFLRGETLEERVAKGPVAIKDALDIARQIADGLDAAHEASIVHRDVKPANVLVDVKGHATIMDFGLARLTEASRLTKLDTAMGTVAYMSPEQAQGMDVDHRSDIWSLGCVIYEMVAGQRPFQGQYDQALLYEIVHEEVAPLTSIRAGVPMELEFIVGKCLAKDREDRYGSAQEIAKDLRTLAEKLKSGRSTVLRATQMTGAVPAMAGGTVNPAATLPPDAVVTTRGRQRAVQALSVATTLGLLALTIVHFREPAPRSLPVVELSDDGPPTGALREAIGLSPDGSHLAMSAGSLWVRALDSVDWRELAGTERARYPFGSPDGRQIGFFADGKLKKIALAGGPAQALADAPDGRGGSWNADGVILFAPAPGGAPLEQISDAGGDPVPVTEAGGDGSLSQRFPQFLPDGEHFLFQLSGVSADRMGIYVGSLEGEPVRRLLPDGSNAMFVPSERQGTTGSLLFVREDTLMAQPFDTSKLELAGGPVTLPVSPPHAGNTSFYGFSASDSGVLAYSSSPLSGPRRLVWVDRNGTVVDRTELVADGMLEVVLSPDGKRVAYTADDGANRDVWVYDLMRGTRVRLTNQPDFDLRPFWSPDGLQIAFRPLMEASAGDIYLVQADGAGVPESLISDSDEQDLFDWSSDGRYILYGSRATDQFYDLWYLERAQSGQGWEPHPFLQTPANEEAARLSPDGRYIAYQSNESGRDEIYVQPFPGGGRRTPISSAGGIHVVWSRDGKELFYVASDELMAVSVSTEGEFSMSESKSLFRRTGMSTEFYAPFDVSLDGRRFLVAEAVDANGEPKADSDSPVRIVLNWQEKFLSGK